MPSISGVSSVVVVGLAGKAGNPKLHTCFDVALPAGLVVDGEIVDADLFGRELKAFVAQHKLRGRPSSLAVSNQKVIVRNIDMPEMTEAEMLGAIEFQAQDYIPIPVEDVGARLPGPGQATDAGGQHRQEVLLVAAQRTMIKSLLSCRQTRRA